MLPRKGFLLNTHLVRRILSACLVLIALCGYTSQTASAINLIDCISVQGNGLGGYPPSQLTYSISVQFTCSGGPLTGQVGTLSLNIPGLTVGNSIVSIYASSYAQSFNFNLFSPRPGTYSPSVTIITSNPYSTKTAYLGTFTVQAPPSPQALPPYGNPSPSPTDSLPYFGASPSASALNHGIQICSSSSGIAASCSDWPNWSYSICSTNPSGYLYQQSGKSWIKLWKFQGVKDGNCTSQFPFDIQIYAKTSSSQTGTTNFQLRFAGSQSHTAFNSNFKIVATKQ
jgi:hypothetical protein